MRWSPASRREANTVPSTVMRKASPDVGMTRTAAASMSRMVCSAAVIAARACCSATFSAFWLLAWRRCARASC